MKCWWIPTLGNQRGVALPLALFALVMLSGLLLAFLTMAGMEPTIAANLNDITRGRYVADAGVEWAYDQLAGNANWNGILLGPDGQANTADDGRLASGVSLPGDPAATFSATVRNDTQAGDTTLTGQATLDPGGPTNDTNGIVIVTASGIYQGATRQIQVVVRRIGLPPLPGAVNFPGLQAEIDPGGPAHLHTNGVDYNRNGSLGTGPLKFGITVANSDREKEVEDSLTRHHKNEMTGRDQTKPCCVAIQRGSDETCPCEGERTIVPQALLPANEQLTSQKVADFIAKVKGSVNVLQSKTGSAGITIQNGKPLGANSSLPINLGTTSAPTITYIKGSTDEDNQDRVLRFRGDNSGAGILIVEDGTVEIDGSFRWDGVILVTGKDVGVRFVKGSRAFIYGGMVVNEVGDDDDTPEMLIDQNAHGSSSVNQVTFFYASEQNLNMVRGMRAFVRLSTWREI